MRALIITGGSLLDPNLAHSYKNDHDIIICADSGANYLHRAQIVPHILIGDFDSIESSVLNEYYRENVTIVKHPPEKDYTDTQLAVKHACNLGCTSITILGGIGHRIDHTIANIYVMVDIIKGNINCMMENDYCKIQLSKGYLEVNSSPGETISLLPLTDKVENIDIEGFKYPINNGFMEKGNPYGVSNILMESKGIIRHKTGILAVIHAKKL